MNKKEHSEKKQNASIINVVFDGKKAFVNEDKRTVVCLIDFCLIPKDTFKHIAIYSEPHTAIGKSTCSDTDDYIEKRGVLIASTRSENDAYTKAIDELRQIEKEANKLINSVSERISLLKAYIEHNKKFINDLIDEGSAENSKG